MLILQNFVKAIIMCVDLNYYECISVVVVGRFAQNKS